MYFLNIICGFKNNYLDYSATTPNSKVLGAAYGLFGNAEKYTFVKKAIIFLPSLGMH